MEDIWQLGAASGASDQHAAATEPSGMVDLISDLEPLDAQTEETDRKSVPDTLAAPLFGVVGDVEMSTFAILDAAKITDLPEILIGSGLDHQCLFVGAAQEELGHVAPWIVRLEEDNSFTRSLFTLTDPPSPWTHWSKDAGIYLRSTASLADLCAHFRKFTKVRMDGVPDGDRTQWQYFRFYDPEQATLYFNAIRAWPDRMAQFYRLHDGTLVDRIITLSSVAATAHIFAPDPEALPVERPNAFVFQSRDAHVFASARRPRFRQELAEWLLRMDEPRFKPFSEEQLYALVDHGLREGDALKFTFKEEYVYLLYMMSYFGGWFHKSGRMPEISRILVEDGRARRANLEPAFLRAHSDLMGDADVTYRNWAKLFTQLDGHLTKAGGWTRFNPDTARQLIMTATPHLGDEDRARLDEFLRRVEYDCDARKVTHPSARGVVLLFSYTMGHAFFEDPLFPWAIELAAEHDTLEPALPAIAEYAMKRGRKMLADFQKGAA
ncbi:uncharacterized protein DUF4123 [Litoreibacter halocynthiae]|uniref:Uncharacterized protein DUF4123 n=1 Tax=Litoreibacter halocynthiae TaxID=1242689 RepID=A0A4R7LH21_9RHOB|nr:DUF4123 domain-containing protein [Litoreibacter halocynthiae]TDT75043.1 uncharacterized protein DUF4123 [Litoreibacter halocynthiae]